MLSCPSCGTTARLARRLHPVHPTSEDQPDQADTDPLHFDNIKTQRQLSDEGRKQAQTLGEPSGRSSWPTEKVISSKFHRAQEAATLLDMGEVSVSAT